MSINAASAYASVVDFDRFYQVTISEEGQNHKIRIFEGSEEYFKKVRKLQKALSDLDLKKEAEAVGNTIRWWSEFKDRVHRPNPDLAMKVDILAEAMKRVFIGCWAKVPYVPLTCCDCDKLKFYYIIQKVDENKVNVARSEEKLLNTQYYWSEIMVPGREVEVEGYL